MANLGEIIEDERGFLRTDALGKKLIYEPAKIIRAFFGYLASDCLDGTQAPKGLNIEFDYASIDGAVFCLISDEHIRKFLERMRIKSIKNLKEKQIGTYNIEFGPLKYQTKVVGISEPRRI